ncbi:MAG: hypothetical protein H0V92_05535 [Pseudonocardiales bacterium]|nr:hypothetical protein [Pseudonocardiales bacterium]
MHEQLARWPAVTDRAAKRAVEFVVVRLAGDREHTEIPVGGFDVVVPAAPVDKASAVAIALVTEGAVVPLGNPDRLEWAAELRKAGVQAAILTAT